MKQILKSIVYRILYPFLLFVHGDALLRSLSGHRRLIVFFHGVASKNPFQINGRHMPVGQFEKLLLYFKRNFEIVTLEEICEMKLEGINPDRRTIALTFDDGFLNNLTVALPLLEKHNVKATFFISTRSLEDESYIHPSDFLDLIKVASSENQIEMSGTVFYKSRSQLLSRGGQSAYQFLNALSFKTQEEVLAKLASVYEPGRITKNVEDEVYKLISKGSISKLASSSFAAIGSHGHDHINLNVLSAAELEKQLMLSRTTLEKDSSQSVKSIAFPYGNFNDEVIAASRKAGYQYLIAGGDVEGKYGKEVFPRIGVSSMRGFAYNALSISRGFRRFGF